MLLPHFPWNFSTVTKGKRAIISSPALLTGPVVLEVWMNAGTVSQLKRGPRHVVHSIPWPGASAAGSAAAGAVSADGSFAQSSAAPSETSRSWPPCAATAISTCAPAAAELWSYTFVTVIAAPSPARPMPASGTLTAGAEALPRFRRARARHFGLGMRDHQTATHGAVPGRFSGSHAHSEFCEAAVGTAS